jgi:hypothetical protein
VRTAGVSASLRQGTGLPRQQVEMKTPGIKPECSEDLDGRMESSLTAVSPPVGRLTLLYSQVSKKKLTLSRVRGTHLR